MSGPCAQNPKSQSDDWIDHPAEEGDGEDEVAEVPAEDRRQQHVDAADEQDEGGDGDAGALDERAALDRETEAGRRGFHQGRSRTRTVGLRLLERAGLGLGVQADVVFEGDGFRAVVDQVGDDVVDLLVRQRAGVADAPGGHLVPPLVDHLVDVVHGRDGGVCAVQVAFTDRGEVGRIRVGVARLDDAALQLGSVAACAPDPELVLLRERMHGPFPAIEGERPELLFLGEVPVGFHEPLQREPHDEEGEEQNAPALVALQQGGLEGGVGGPGTHAVRDLGPFAAGPAPGDQGPDGHEDEHPAQDEQDDPGDVGLCQHPRRHPYPAATQNGPCGGWSMVFVPRGGPRTTSDVSTVTRSPSIVILKRSSPRGAGPS